MGDIVDGMFQDGLLDGPGDDDGWPSVVRCRYCRKDGLHWSNTVDGWRLVDDNYVRHTCSPSALLRTQTALFNNLDA